MGNSPRRSPSLGGYIIAKLCGTLVAGRGQQGDGWGTVAGWDISNHSCQVLPFDLLCGIMTL